MKTLLTLLLLAASAFGQTATITDTITTPFGGTFSGTVTVSLNSPGLAQPLYSGNVTLSGWTQSVTVTAGAFTLTLYTNDLITPGGTSYTATYAPTSGSGWKETWIVPSGATTIREIRSTTVPSPSVRFTPSQITQAGATLGQGLRWNGSIWAPASVLTDPMTTTGDLITRSGINAVRVGIGSTNQVLTVSGGMPVWASGITGNASTATSLAANGTNCSAGSYPLGVDASGNAEGCTVAGGGGGSGTVTSVSVVSANGVSGTVANPTTTPAITLSLGAITPSSVAASGTVTGSNLSGTNTGDQTNIAGNAATATALQTARNINGVPFNGTADITVTANLPSNPAACPGGQYVTDIAADGTLTCGTPAGGGSSTTACEIIIGDPGAATPILADDNDTPAVCSNVSGTTQTITAIACWAHAGSPTVRPIITGGASNSLLSSDLTCGPQTYAPGTLNGTPTLAAGQTIDANIASAGGVAKYIVIRITRQ